MRVKPEEGLDVIVTGRLTTFAGSSKYQIVIDTLEPAGIGALMELLEERKKKLAAEGLFDEARKQLLPFLPEVIGVVTSPTGAVIRDILHRLADRFPRRVLVWPVRVQGETSAAEVAAAIDGFNALPEGGPLPRPDLIIVARGGGSLEDLWSFNEEIVVRAAAASMIPLISAVGHETDFTLIDFAADRRAPTPTAAAEKRGAGARRAADAAFRRSASASLPAGNAASSGAARNCRCSRAPCRRTFWRCRGSGSIAPRALAARAARQCADPSHAVTRVSPGGSRRSFCATSRTPARALRQFESAALGERARQRASASRAASHVIEIGSPLVANSSRRAMLTLLDRHDARLERADRLLRRLLVPRGAEARLCAGARRRGSSAAHGRGKSSHAACALDIEFSDGRVGAVAEGEPCRGRRARPRAAGGGWGSDEGQGSLFG